MNVSRLQLTLLHLTFLSLFLFYTVRSALVKIGNVPCMSAGSLNDINECFASESPNATAFKECINATLKHANSTQLSIFGSKNPIVIAKNWGPTFEDCMKKSGGNISLVLNDIKKFYEDIAKQTTLKWVNHTYIIRTTYGPGNKPPNKAFSHSTAVLSWIACAMTWTFMKVILFSGS